MNTTNTPRTALILGVTGTIGAEVSKKIIIVDRENAVDLMCASTAGGGSS